MSLAVIIVSYNVRDLLRACLRATYDSLAASPELQAEVMVVDNASTDASAEMVAAEFPQARLTVSSKNLGFAGGNNLALRALGFADGRDARPDFVLLLNPDAEPQGEALARMVDFLKRNPHAGGVGPRLSYPDGRFQHSAFAFPGLTQLWFDFFKPRPRRLLESRWNGRYPLSLYDADEPFPVDFVLGAALMTRRETIDAVGLMDEGYFMYAEEVDWCWRMQRAGWPFYCAPAAHVIHHGGASAGQFRARSFVNLWRSRKRLYERFYTPAQLAIAGGIVRLGMGAEASSAHRAARRGEIGEVELMQRLAATREVADLFGKRQS